MLKIISAERTREADQFTIKNEPIESIDLMERASLAFVERFCSLVGSDKRVSVVCGPGNNGGDGLAVARILRSRSYRVDVTLLDFSELSEDCRINLERLNGEAAQVKPEQFRLPQTDAVIDAVFGSGLNRPIIGELAEVIKVINSANAKIYSVDIPSGLLADEVDLTGVIVQADYTITFQRPKLSFLIPESGRFVGEWYMEDIGLDESFIDSSQSDFFLVDDHVMSFLPPRKKFQHKGDFGRVQVFAGSLGKIGAAFLCAKAVMRSGAGLLTIHTPACGMPILQTSLPEAMLSVDQSYEHISSGELMQATDVVCFGPGIGKHSETAKNFRRLLESRPGKLVVDADGLNILSQNPELMDLLPEGTVLTPHVGEFNRLFGDFENGLERINFARSVAFKRKLVIILKGAHTAVITPDKKVYFNNTGNPGMATAGSGDVLAGIVSGLLAQGLSPEKAAQMGVFVHGRAADFAKKTCGEVSMMASDLLNFLHRAICND